MIYMSLTGFWCIPPPKGSRFISTEVNDQNPSYDIFRSSNRFLVPKSWYMKYESCYESCSFHLNLFMKDRRKGFCYPNLACSVKFVSQRCLKVWAIIFLSSVNIRGTSQSMFLSSHLLPSFRHCCSHDVHAWNRERVERHSAESGVRRWRRPLLRWVGGHREATRPGHLLWAREGVWEQTSRSGNWWLLLCT